MHISLSDVVTCPRCGPGYGLVLLPYEVRDRRVVAGVLGCPNCRERYPVEGGVPDLRVPGEEEPRAAVRSGGGPSGEDPSGGEPSGEAVRLAALLDLAEATGTVLLLGPAGSLGGEVAALVGGVEVVVGPGGGESGLGVAGGDHPVTRLRLGSAIPFRTGSLRGVALTGGEAERLEEGARVVAPGGRLLAEPCPDGARERLEAAGLRVLAVEGGTLVAGR